MVRFTGVFVAAKRSFGVSTHLYHGSRLNRDHLLEIGACGFEGVEVFATRTHFDYHSTTAVGDLQQWLAEAGLELHSVHAPIGEGFTAGRWQTPLTLASSDRDRRAQAVGEAERALHIARRIPFKVLVAHLGVPRRTATAAADNSRDGARRSVEELRLLAEPLGVRIAVEVIPNELSRAGSLVHFVEDVIDAADVGICLDVGHAHLDGDLVEAIETVSEHLIAVDVHDNHGRADDHLVPFEGSIDWPGALTVVQKVGYDGPLMLEIGARGSTRDTLGRARKAREKMERLLAD
jgi:sugar phosphate isomerase/epimerase